MNKNTNPKKSNILCKNALNSKIIKCHEFKILKFISKILNSF